MSDSLRLTEILTTASAIANFAGDSDVGPRHLLDAIAVLEGAKGMDDFGRPVSPLVPRGKAGADPAVREIAQRWFAALGSDVEAGLSATQLDELRAELLALGLSGEDR
jgi:hypothetical protein